MKKLFISQPMRGLTDAEIMRARRKAKAEAEEILNENVEVLDSFFAQCDHEVNPLYYLGKALMILSEADYAIFVEGWDKSRGCWHERNACEDYGIPILKACGR